MDYLIQTLGILVVLSALCGFLLHLLWKRVMDKYDLLNFSIIAFYVVLQFTSALSWCLALMPPLNDQNDLIISGIGGAAYGLQFDLYPASATLYVVGAVISTALGFVFIRGTGRREENLFQALLLQFGNLPLSAIAKGGLALSVIYTVLNYTYLGWERLWKSDLDRFEFEYGKETFLGFVDGRLFAVGTFFISLGLVVVALVAKDRIRWQALLAVLIFATPSISLGSRRGSLLLFAVVWVLWWRAKSRRLWLVPTILISAFIYILPLKMREEPGSGFFYLVEAVKKMGDPEQFALDKELIRVMCNYGQGLPVFVEAMSLEESGIDILNGTPPGYMVISFSPFPSLIDNYKLDFLDFHPRINLYTPFSSYAELFSVNWLLGIFFTPCIVLIAHVVIRRLRVTRGWNGWVALILASGLTITLLHMQQYNLRQASRFYLYALDFACIALVLLKIAPRSSESPRWSGQVLAAPPPPRNLPVPPEARPAAGDRTRP